MPSQAAWHHLLDLLAAMIVKVRGVESRCRCTDNETLILQSLCIVQHNHVQSSLGSSIDWEFAD